MVHDVFISHSLKDKKTADAICHALENNGVKCWIDPRDVKPGAEYAGEITNGLENCRILLLILSNESNMSDTVLKEVETAFKYGKTIIHFLLETVEIRKSLECYLSNIHRLETFPDDKEFDSLVQSVMAALGMKKIPESNENAAIPVTKVNTTQPEQQKQTQRQPEQQKQTKSKPESEQKKQTQPKPEQKKQTKSQHEQQKQVQSQPQPEQQKQTQSQTEQPNPVQSQFQQQQPQPLYQAVNYSETPKAVKKKSKLGIVIPIALIIVFIAAVVSVYLLVVMPEKGYDNSNKESHDEIDDDDDNNDDNDNGGDNNDDNDNDGDNNDDDNSNRRSRDKIDDDDNKDNENYDNGNDDDEKENYGENEISYYAEVAKHSFGFEHVPDFGELYGVEQVDEYYKSAEGFIYFYDIDEAIEYAGDYVDMLKDEGYTIDKDIKNEDDYYLSGLQKKDTYIWLQGGKEILAVYIIIPETYEGFKKENNDYYDKYEENNDFSFSSE